MNFKEHIICLENNSSSIKNVINLIRKLHTLWHRLTLFPGEFYRGLGGESENFLPLKNLKGLYQGERCFIIATGPSLKEEDVLALKNEYTFGMNSLCKLFPKISWRPTFYGIQDIFVYDKLVDELGMTNTAIVLVGDNIAQKRNIKKEWIRFPLNCAYNEYEQYVKGFFPVKFSDNCYKVVYNGFSITFSLIQLAVYMGFTEIFLLGADCSFSKTGKNHFAEHGHMILNIETVQARNFAMYECVKEYAERHHVKIFNATRGGELEIFPRIQFDDIIKK